MRWYGCYYISWDDVPKLSKEMINVWKWDLHTKDTNGEFKFLTLVALIYQWVRLIEVNTSVYWVVNVRSIGIINSQDRILLSSMRERISLMS